MFFAIIKADSLQVAINGTGIMAVKTKANIKVKYLM